MEFSKKFRVIAIIALGMALIGACSQQSAQEELRSPLTMGLMGSLDAVPLIIAKEEGYFEEEGVTVNLESFTSARDRDIAFQGSEEIDGVMFDLVAVGIYNDNGIPVTVTSASDGAIGILANENVQSLEELKGKTVIISRNTAMEYILNVALESVGLTMEDVIIEEVPALPTRLELISNGQADVAIIPDPFFTMGLERGLHSLGTNEDLGVNPFVYVFREEVVNTKQEELKAFYRAYNKAIDFMNNSDESAYIDYVIQTVGYPESLRDDLIIPIFPKHYNPSQQQVEHVLDWAKTKGLVTTDLSFEDVVSRVGFE